MGSQHQSNLKERARRIFVGAGIFSHRWENFLCQVEKFTRVVGGELTGSAWRGLGQA